MRARRVEEEFWCGERHVHSLVAVVVVIVVVVIIVVIVIVAKALRNGTLGDVLEVAVRACGKRVDEETHLV